MPVLNLYGTLTAGAVTGTTLGHEEPVALAGTPAGLRLLYDDDDSTYIALRGGGVSGTDESWLTGFNTVVRDVDQNAFEILPTNAVIATVTFIFRARQADTGCAMSPSVLGEVYLDDHFYGQTTPGADFGEWSLLLLSQPSGDPWDSSSIYVFPYLVGLRCRFPCQEGDSQTGIDWSEARIEVTFNLPRPTLTPQPPQDLSPYSVALRGTLNPNQQALVPPVLAYPLDYGFTMGVDPNLLPIVEYEGVISSGGTDTHTIIGEPRETVPGITYYFALGARDPDGIETLSAVSSFTAPFTDPLKGVF